MANFREVFEADYCGHQLFTDKVLIPVFGNIQQNWKESFDNDLTDNDKKIIQSVYRFGNFSLTLGDEMLCFDVTLQPNIQLAKSKVQIQQFIRRLILVNSAALIVFHYPVVTSTEWRVSFVYKEKNATEGTPAKRYTYLIGKNKHCRTAGERFGLLATKEKSIKNIIEAFNVESLTKDFYNELFSWYQWALNDNDGFAVKYPNDTSTDTDDRKIDEHLIRLITRLMFVWFIKQKGLVPNNIFSIDSLKKILKNFDPYSIEQGNYYNGILQNLFFATLNKTISERAFANDSTKKEDGKEHYGIKTLFRNPKGDSWFQIPNSEVVKLFSQVPFLNGGLFECLDKEKDNSKKILYFDGFSREEKVNGFLTRAFVPNCLFFDPQKGIIPLLERYNFTIEENTPTEVEVALDPELLGKVFENLLGAYNPETKETARKQSGSFYTPREIVSYMVDESLIAFLHNSLSKTPEGSNVYSNEISAKGATPSGSNISQSDNSINISPRCGEDATNNNVTELPTPEGSNVYRNDNTPENPTPEGSNHIETLLRRLFAPDGNADHIHQQTRTHIINALKSAKILDPACGSGAFPMGVLNRMVDLLQKLNDEEAKTPYDQKLHLIQNCIYGVDIQTIAVQISKLRFFISLVCEQPRNESAENFGITPLPNLETKFVAANTLIGLNKGFSDRLDLGFTQIRELKDKLWDIRRLHFSARNASEKHELRKQDETLRKAIEKQIVSIATKPDPAKIERLQVDIQILQAEKEKFTGERWVSIAPPEAKQMSIFHSPAPEQLNLKIDKNREERDRIDKLIKDKQKELLKETSKTSQPGFESEAAQLAKWNPYDQNTSSPFFDIEWMFDVKEGFDVVIGNPPYVQLQKDGGKLAIELKSQNFETFEKTGDIYALFYEKGFQILNSNGIHTFITSSQWMKAAYGKSLRKYFLKQNPLKLILLGPGAFENAIVDTNIMIAQKGKFMKELKGAIVNNNLTLIAEIDFVEMSYITDASWAIIDNSKQTIKSKIENKGKPLKDWNIEIYRGVLTGYNEAFIIDQSKRDELVAKDPKLTEIIKPILRGRGIEKYVTVWDGDYINFLPWHFPLHDDATISGASKEAENQFKLKYSVLYEFFLSHKEGLLKRNKDETGIRYEWYALQRCAATYKDEFKKEKVVWKRIGSQLRFSYTSEEVFCLDSTCIATGEKVKYLTALLNSKLCNYELFENAPKTGMGDLIISVQALEPLHVYYPNNKEEKLIVTLVDRILAAKKANPQANTLPWEAEIDARVFQLYGLTEEEMLQVLTSLPSVSEAERSAVQAQWNLLKNEK